MSDNAGCVGLAAVAALFFVAMTGVIGWVNIEQARVEKCLPTPAEGK